MARLRLLIGNELRLLLGAPRGLAALLLPPLLQLLVFGYAATFDVDRAPIAIMNEDPGPHGRDLAARFAASPVLEVVAQPVRDDEVPPLLDAGTVVMVVRIGPRFSAELAAGAAPEVQALLDGRLLNTALTVQSYAAAVVAGFNRDHVAANGLAQLPAFTVTRAWFNPNLLSHWYVVPGLVAKILLIVTLTTVCLSIVREREQGTLDRLLMAPFTALHILLGKLAAALLVGLVQGAAMAAMAVLWFGVPFRGAPALLALCFAAMLLAAIGIGLLISACARTQPQAILATFAVAVPAIMLSGFATPIASMPAWIQAITLVNPIRYFIAVTRTLFLRGGGWDAVWPELLPIIAIALATLAAAWARIRRRLD